MIEHRTHTLPDGRNVDLALAGDPTAPAVVFHHGTPQAHEEYPPLVEAVTSRGLRWIARSRPGYGGSTRRPGRTVRDDADDVAAVLDALGVERFLSMGWSGGGPHALASGAVLAPRCAGVVSIAGVAPYVGAAESGLDFLEGTGPENHEEFGAALESEQALRTYLEPQAAELVGVTGAQVGEALGGLVDAPDLAVLTGGYAEHVAASFRESVSSGVDGWADDDLAFTTPWGFELTDVTVPVAVWQGSEDRMVPYAHGQWLAEHLPDARVHLLPGEGHLSVGIGRFDEMVEEALTFLR
ncbi:alpha/beta fold hydrolase [Jatrophihabitans sp. YIM 134969]